MVLLALPPPDHLLIERDRGQFVPSRRRRMMANVRAERLLKIPAEPSPELRIPGAAAQTRVVSLAGIRLRASSAGVARASIGQELLQRRAVERGAGECAVVVAAGDQPPRTSSMSTAGRKQTALGVVGVPRPTPASWIIPTKLAKSS